MFITPRQRNFILAGITLTTAFACMAGRQITKNISGDKTELTQTATSELYKNQNFEDLAIWQIIDLTKKVIFDGVKSGYVQKVTKKGKTTTIEDPFIWDVERLHYLIEELKARLTNPTQLEEDWNANTNNYKKFGINNFDAFVKTIAITTEALEKHLFTPLKDPKNHGVAKIGNFAEAFNNAIAGKVPQELLAHFSLSLKQKASILLSMNRRLG